MSRLLLDESPLMVSPSLARRIGLNEAIILQQIHYWLQKSQHEYDGLKWTYNSYEQWQQQFPWWSTKTIQRTITNLKNLNLLRIENLNKSGHLHTNWYTINYNVLDELEVDKVDVQIDQDNLSTSIRSDCPMDEDNLSKSIYLDYSKTTSETTIAADRQPAEELATVAAPVEKKEKAPLDELDDLREQVTGRLIPSANEIMAMKQILALAKGNISEIRSVIQENLKIYRANHGGKAPNSIKYFVPIFEEYAAAEKARAAPVGFIVTGQPEPQVNPEELRELNESIRGNMPDWMRREVGEDG